MGKRTLVRRVLYDQTLADQTVTLCCQPGSDLVLDVIWALSRVVREPLDWLHVQRDRELSLASVIDLADAGGLVVVLEQVHQASPHDVHDVLVTASRYARRSRWLVTTCEELVHVPIEVYLGQTLHLEPMEQEALQQLAQRLRPTLQPERCAHYATKASGHPGRLLQLLTSYTLPHGMEQELPLLRVLKALHRAVPWESLQGVCPQLTLDRLRPLHRAQLLWLDDQGHIALTAGGQTLDMTDLEREEREALVESLVSWSTAETLLEAMTLVLHVGQLERADAMLEEHHQLLMQEGLVLELRRLLRTHAQHALPWWHLRLELALGDRQSISHRLPQLKALASNSLQHLYTGIAARMAGQYAEANTHFEQVVLNHLPMRQREQAITEQAETLGQLGRFEEALALLNVTEDLEDWARRQRQAQASNLLLEQGHAAQGLALVHQLRAELPHTEGEERIQLLRQLLQALRRGQQVHEAEALLRAESKLFEGASAVLRLGRRLIMRSVSVHLTVGRLDAAAEKLTTLLPHISDGPSQRRLETADLLRRFFQGELEGFEQRAQALLAQAKGDMGLHLSLLMVCCTLATAQGQRFDEPIPPHADQVYRVLMYQYLLCRHQNRVLLSDPNTVLDDHHAPQQLDLYPELHGQHQHVAALQQLALHNDHHALKLLEPTLAKLQAAHLGLQLSEMLPCMADLRALMGHWLDWEQTLTQMQTLAHTMPSQRMAAWARWWRVVRAQPWQPADLEPLAHMQLVAPEVARRTRALLGEREVVLDALDTRVLHELGWMGRVRTVGPSDTPVVAGLNLETRQVWTPDGHHHDLRRSHKSRTLLATLLSRPHGRASKEELVLALWPDLHEYHPLKHDNRLRLAAHRLRATLGPVGDTIITLDDGYGLQARWRLYRETHSLLKT
ncbi:MAG: hypothetical protein AAFS10_10335 [Myxococcota bacterium]